MQDVTELACRARDGDTDALAEFIRASINDVRRYCAALVDAASADDLTQDSYLKAIGALRRYRGDAPASAWLLGIARHTCIDEIRRRRRRRDIEQPTLLVEQLPDDDIAGAITVQIAIQALADDRREALVLTQILGMSYAEAAQAIGCPVGTVRSRVFRARADLLDALADSDGAARSTSR